MLFWRYYFGLKEGSVVVEKIIYAPSEKLARKIFEKEFKVEAGPLLRRENW